jgi:hypothetical protein
LTWDVLPCVIKGQVKQKNRIYNFELNAGGWFYVFCGNTILRFDNFKKQNEKYFLSKADNE